MRPKAVIRNVAPTSGKTKSWPLASRRWKKIESPKLSRSRKAKSAAVTTAKTTAWTAAPRVSGQASIARRTTATSRMRTVGRASASAAAPSATATQAGK